MKQVNKQLPNLELTRNSKIIIITPVYNVIDYLKRCLDSILSQTYRDFCLILVDDGSTDGSSDILRLYEKKDNRIVLLTNPQNCGIAKALNRALDYSAQLGVAGGYFTFIDSDDWIEPTYLEHLVHCHKRSGADIVCVDKRGKFDRKYEKCWSGEKAVAYFCSMRKISGYPRKSFDRNLFSDMRFRSIALGRDGIFSFEALIRAKKVFVSNHFLYHYTIRLDSDSERGVLSQKHIDATLIQLQIDRDILEASKKKLIYMKYFRVFEFTLCLNLLKQIYAYNKHVEFADAIRQCKIYIKRNRWVAFLYTKNLKTYIKVLQSFFIR